MKDGFVKVAASAIDVVVGDCRHNAEQIIQKTKEAVKAGAKILVLPELCLTGYTCGDLFWHRTLLDGAVTALEMILQATCDDEILLCFGMPVLKEEKLYNCAVLVFQGEILGFVPKKNLPNYGEFYEKRIFTPGSEAVGTVSYFGEEIPFGTSLLFCCSSLPELKIVAEVCEDLWVTDSPSQQHVKNGATVILNVSASNEVIGKKQYRKDLLKAASGTCLCAYIYADAGNGESSTDLIFAGHSMIAQNGKLLAEAKLFENETVYGVIDVQMIENERRRLDTFLTQDDGYTRVFFKPQLTKTPLPNIRQTPFVPDDHTELTERCEEILNMQAFGLVKRLRHTNAKRALIGISGGLDSTLALLVTVRAFDLLHKDRKDIIAVTMPCFGTTGRTYQNALRMMDALGVTAKEIDVKDSVLQHFHDIGHDESDHDVTYENSQARERTQVLMDLANQENGIVIGTGDLSELALGWATYNGDHMSMYGVNASIPKTLIRYLVSYLADTTDQQILHDVLHDVLNTPVSPELLPPENGKIAQKTEELVGPYELHDFFLYYFMRYQFAPSKIRRLACHAFSGKYDEAVIQKWLETFLKRFFSQQYKRSCVPDGPKVGTVALSPRGDLKMPSDASVALWLEELS